MKLSAVSSSVRRIRRSVLVQLVCAGLVAGALVDVVIAGPTEAAGSPCGANVNPIACENQQTGSPEADWDVNGYGDASIQGFATDISVNAGSAINFKIDTSARAYTIDIYRLGYYRGDGARFIQSVNPSASLPQTQPPCATNPSTSLYDCGTWKVSASWPVPASSVSGVYLALLTRSDTGGRSQITFVVRNDASTSDIVYQTSDETWQAYNRYGGADFYTGDDQNLYDSPSRARALSYNRPFITRGDNEGRDFLFSNEYPTIRFLEKNGYDVSYIAGVDTDRFGSTLLAKHKVFMSVGHDEYWSQNQRTNVANARDAGVNLMFLSGNEVYWHTRFAASIDGTNTAYRTLICYKDAWDNAPTDPTEATSTYRDPRYGTAPGGSNPENSLTGTMYMANSDDLPVTVTKGQGALRMWRNTGLAAMTGASTALAPHTVGYESDEDVDNGFRPGGLIDMSTTTGSTPQELVDFGQNVVAGTTTHHITLYRASSGALVFGAGTIQWGWGLDNDHDGTESPADSRMQQATVNMLADMKAQPSTLQSGLAAASASTDAVAPTSTITSPAAGGSIANGKSVTVTGTAADQGGVVGGVEVSLDGGATWHPATGTTSWSYTGILHGAGAVKIEARATDDSANVQAPSSVSVTVTCPCSLFGDVVPGTTPGVGSGVTTASEADSHDGGAYELGTAFTSTVDGFVTGVRFYKASTNTGVHTGTLWSASGTALATGTFTNETATGWQTLAFSTPVAVTKGTTYVASYWAPNGHYSDQPNFFYYAPYSANPLQAPNNTPSNDSVNGFFATSHTRPTDTYQGTNYFVDVTFTEGGTGSSAPTVTAQSPKPGASGVATSAAPSATFSEAVTSGSITFTLKTAAGASVAGTVGYDSTSHTATFTPSSALAVGTQYTATVNASDTSGQAMAAPATWTFTTAFADSTCPCTILGDAWTPTTASVDDGKGTEVGVRFTTDTAGVVTGVRFYKGSQNTGTHVGSLWTESGSQLASVTFTGESDSGWQTATFSSPVAVDAGTTYVVAYHTDAGFYSATDAGFATAGIDNFPLHVATHGSLYSYSASSVFPSTTSDANYGVDVVFTVPSSVVPQMTSSTPAAGATGVDPAAPIAATFSTSVLKSGTTMTVTGPGGTNIAGATTFNAAQNIVTFTPTSALAAGTAYSVSITGARSLSGTPQSGPATFGFTTATSGGGGGGGGSTGCPCTLFGSTTPANADSGDTSSVTLGLRFTPSQSGFITGVRFYKSSANTGSHVGTLWSASGTQLATVTFANESATGWQTASFASPVAVTAGTTYVVGYLAPKGHYSYNSAFFATAYTNGPLTAPAGSNGTYTYGATTKFPTSSFNNTNYWVDAVFTSSAPADSTPPTVSSTTPADKGTNVSSSAAPSATFSEPVTASSITFTLADAAQHAVTGTVAYDATSRTATFTPSAKLADGTLYTASVTASDTAGNAMAAPRTWSFTTTGGCPCTLFASTDTPSVDDSDDPGSVTLGVKFTPASSGYITGVRFYKGAANTGTHVGTLWSAGGTSMATVTFANESASGWQAASFPSPVPVTGGTTYVVSYNAPNGHYSATNKFFNTAYTNGPLSAPAGTNGVYTYGTGATFPTSTFDSSNYWVDAVYSSTPPADTTAPTISSVDATGSGTSATITWSTDEASTSRVDYGTSASSLSSNATSSGSGTSHSVGLTGLVAGTTYYFRVTSTDAAGNSATSPATSAAPATYTAPVATPSSITDTNTSDFTGGSTSSTYASDNGGGEVVLAPATAVEFTGSTLPSGMTSTNRTGGSSTVSNGTATVQNADLTTTATYSSGRAFETIATLGRNQTVGWYTSSNSSVAMSFSVNASNQLVATVNDGFVTNASGVAASGWTAAPHKFRIEWTSSAATFYVDDAQKYTHSFSSFYSNLRPRFSDTLTTDAGLVVDWFRIAPYAASGAFTSRVFDAKAAVSWGSLSWDATVPTGTTLVVKVRTGNTATPDASWTAYATIPSSGSQVSAQSRYLQYQLTFTTSGSRFVSPTVRSVTVTAAGT